MSTGLLLLVLAAVLHLTAPNRHADASQLYLQRARVIQGASLPGEGAPEFPGSTAWIAYPLAVVQAVSATVGGKDGESTPAYLERTESQWRAVLHGLWSLLGAAVILLAASVAGRWVPSDRRGAVAAGVLAAALLWAAPGWASALASLSPAIPAAVLLLLLVRETLTAAPPSAARAIGFGFLLGAILAWAAFLWPCVLVAAAIALWRRWPAPRLAGALLTAVVVALIAEPLRLLDLGAGAEMFLSEWSREGGAAAGLAGQGSLWRFLTLDALIGPLVLLAALVVTVASLRAGAGGAPATAGRRLLVWFLAVFALVVVVPALSGLRSPGSAQIAIVPLISATLAGGVLRWSTGVAVPRGWRALALGAALAAFVAALLPRVQTWQGAIDPESMGNTMVADLSALIGDDPWLLERPLPGTVEAPGRALVLPRDSRRPARYDFAYWPRWYAEFAHVLVAYSQERTNRQREDARVPRHFYGQLEASAELVRTWGRQPGTQEPLYGLYRLRTGSPWTEPLQSRELEALNPVPDLGAFLTGLGAIYAEAGKLRTAAVVLEGGIELSPEDTPLYNNLASVYMAEGEWESAARVLGEGLRRDPKSFELLYNAGRTYAELGAQGRAEQFFRQAIHLRPEYPLTHYHMARCFLEQKKLPLAYAALSRFLELDRDSNLRPQAEEALAELQETLDARRDRIAQRDPSPDGVSPDTSAVRP